MKEFAVKHPFITLLALDTIVCGIVNLVSILKTSKEPESED